MLSIDEKTPKQILHMLAERLRQKRLAANLTQEGLAHRAGVSFGSLKRFEQSGQISLMSLAKLAIALEESRGFETLFLPTSALPQSLDELLAKPPTRQRGRKK